MKIEAIGQDWKIKVRGRKDDAVADFVRECNESSIKESVKRDVLACMIRLLIPKVGPVEPGGRIQTSPKSGNDWSECFTIDIF